MNELDIIRTKEEENFQGYCKILGDTVLLSQDINNLYTQLAELVQSAKADTIDDIACSSQFLLSCQYQLNMGILATLRGHSNDSHYYTRKAIELCAFASRVQKHPYMAQVWLNAGDSNNDYVKYRKKFRPGKLFPSDHKILGELYSRYDICSKMTHPSLYSLSSHVETIKIKKGATFKFHYFRADEKGKIISIKTTFWLYSTHLLIISVFEEVLSRMLKIDWGDWSTQLSAVKDKYLSHIEKWKSLFSGSE